MDHDPIRAADAPLWWGQQLIPPGSRRAVWASLTMLIMAMVLEILVLYQVLAVAPWSSTHDEALPRLQQDLAGLRRSQLRQEVRQERMLTTLRRLNTALGFSVEPPTDEDIP